MGAGMTAETILFVTIAALLEIFVTLILMLAITFAEENAETE